MNETDSRERPETRSVHLARGAYLCPVTFAALLIIAVTIWLGLKIPHGLLTYPDELLTAERSREMLILGRGTVHFNFRPSFAKPPLQYWLTTLSLPKIDNSSTAVRIWPLVYGVLTAVTAGWLMFLIRPMRPWLVPLSVALYVSCPLFPTEATRGLLDTGLTFFTTLAICFVQLARRRPQWWLAVAIACWLGSLQKIPLIFFIWALIVIHRWCDVDQRAALRTAYLPVSVILAAALTSIWPLVQHACYGMPLHRAFAGDEPSKLFDQAHLGSRPYFEVLDGLLASGWAGGIFPLFAALSFVFSRKSDAAAREISVVALATIVFAVIFNFRSVRYALPIVPCLAISLALALDCFLAQGSWRKIAIAFLSLFVAGGFAQAVIKMHHQGESAANERHVAQALQALQSERSDTILIDRSKGERHLRSNAFYLFHGDLRFPLMRQNIEQLAAAPRLHSAVGVCVVRDIPLLQQLYPDTEVTFTSNDLACWRTGAQP